jgi:exoribonuclease R
LEVIRRRTPLEFSAALLEEAHKLMASPPPDEDEGSRMDLTHLQAFAIDDESTQEVVRIES